MYGPNQRNGGALRQFWRWLVLRDNETAPLQTSMHRAVEHRALLTIAVGDLGIANTTTLTLAGMERGWTMFAHTPPRGTPFTDVTDDDAVRQVWESLDTLNRHQIAHGDMRATEITIDSGTALFGGFGRAEYGASEEQLQSDILAGHHHREIRCRNGRGGRHRRAGHRSGAGRLPAVDQVRAARPVAQGAEGSQGHHGRRPGSR